MSLGPPKDVSNRTIIKTTLKGTGIVILILFALRVGWWILGPHYTTYIPPKPKNQITLPSLVNSYETLQQLTDTINEMCPLKPDSVETLISAKCISPDTLFLVFQSIYKMENIEVEQYRKGLVKEESRDVSKHTVFNKMVGFDIAYIFHYVDAKNKFMFNIYYYPTTGYKAF